MLMHVELPPTAGPSSVRLRGSLLAAGVSDPELRAGIKDGSVSRVDRGAYVPGDAAAATVTGRHRHRVEAAARRSPDLVIGHVSAAIVHHYPIWGATLQRVHQIRPGSGGSLRTARRHVHVGRLAPEDIVTVGDIRVTSPARTLVDLARNEGFDTAVIAADFALHAPVFAKETSPRPLVTTEQLTAALARARHLPHIGAARRALRFADGRSESVGESRTRLTLRSCGLPDPELQVDVLDRGLFVARVDLAYPEFAVVIEFDGEAKYGMLLAPGESASGAVIREKQREDDLRRLGLVVVRLTWRELADRRLVHERVAAAVEHGRTVMALGGMTGTLVRRPPIRIAR
mgnify:CR=1 FL=1